jgi:hypothetical protein
MPAKTAAELEASGEATLQWFTYGPFPKIIAVQCVRCGKALPGFATTVSDDDALDGSTQRYMPCSCEA